MAILPLGANKQPAASAWPAAASDGRSAAAPQPGDFGEDQSAARRLREKAAEAEREARRGAKLEEWLARLRGEAVAWQPRRCRSRPPRSPCTRSSVEELAAAGDAGPADSSSSAYVDPCRRTTGPGTSSDCACLGCRLRPASVVLLPCRQLSLCGECFAVGDADAAAMACLVCLCVRTGSVEAISERSFPRLIIRVRSSALVSR
jgi:E3 ubiquitin-protein ligase BOI-like protein